MAADLGSERRRIVQGLQKLGLSAGDAASVVNGEKNARLPEERSLALVAFDADAVQAQVFASPRPVTIQGASRILATWDEGLQKGHERGVVLFAGGGQAVMLARRDDAKGICNDLEQRFREATADSPCTTAQVELSPRDLVHGPSAGKDAVPEALARRIGWSAKAGGGFGACMASLSLAMRVKRGAASDRFFLRKETGAARCEECAERPRDPSGKLCARCQKNHARGAKDKETWDQAATFAKVLGATGEDGQDARDLAFIKLDGRGIGAQLEKLQSIEQYLALSAALREAFELRDLGRFDVPAGRYQIPIAGGDDLLIVVPAQWRSEKGPGDAFTLCKDLLAHVERAFDDVASTALFPGDSGVRKLGAGAGLVVTSGMAASFCFEYAGELVKSAKDAVGEADRSALDFAVLRGGTPLATSPDKLRLRDPLEIHLGGDLEGQVKRTRCPYLLPDLRALLKRAALLARAPRSALHALHAAMREPTTGMLAVRYQLSRHPELREALTGGERLADLPPGLGEWVLAEVPTSDREHDGPRWATGIGDLLDAMPFVTTAPAAQEAGR